MGSIIIISSLIGFPFSAFAVGLFAFYIIGLEGDQLNGFRYFSQTRKSDTLKSLENVTKTTDELTLEEEKDILENKMMFYSASGALEELERLKRLF
ncbi:hypothetical protein V7114_14455 [Neobacillus niacini]|uniref:hypothetical protein n=1 Tax=Neobacillus niacini TaxID=86668 RepID=UPI002FFFCFF7